jgi:excisionase family DNA binding protein
MIQHVGVRMSEDILTVHQAAEILHYHPEHVRRLLRSGRMEGSRFNSVWMIKQTEVQRLEALQGKSGRLPPSKLEYWQG